MGPTLKKILKWLLILLILFVGLSYLFYKINPRKYTYPFIILAHIVPDPPQHPNCVPGMGSDRGIPDFNDSWATPESQHELQHFEWLGKCVTQENVSLAADQYEDGLGAIVFYQGAEWMKGSEFTLKVIVSTSYQYHPDQFPQDTGAIGVYSYIDWNFNHQFETSELVNAWVGSPPFSTTPADPNNTVFETNRITVPAFYEHEGTIPSIRIRLVWEISGRSNPAPGGDNKWGEVEDHFGPQEDVHP
jgi:hypothetical protein